MVSRATVKTDDVVEFTDRLTAMALAVRGDFADEIAAVKAERAGLANDLALLGSADEIAKKRAAADQYLADTKAQADQLTQSAQEVIALANTKVADLTARERAAVARESELSQREARLSADTAARGAALDARRQEIDKAQALLDAAKSDLTDAQDKFAQDRNALDADRDAFNKRLEALKV